MSEKIKSLLSKVIYPDCFKLSDDEYVKTYHNLNSELKDLIENSGYKGYFTKKYHTALRFLLNLKEHCFQQPNLFESLKGEKDLFSIKLFREKNIRILFFSHHIDDRNIVILLNCFEEKSKKDYERGIEVAHKRKKELVEDSK